MFDVKSKISPKFLENSLTWWWHELTGFGLKNRKTWKPGSTKNIMDLKHIALELKRKN